MWPAGEADEPLASLGAPQDVLVAMVDSAYVVLELPRVLVIEEVIDTVRQVRARIGGLADNNASKASWCT